MIFSLTFSTHLPCTFSDAAASEAADWAIARSLSALKSAEAKGELEKQDSDEGSADSGKSV